MKILKYLKLPKTKNVNLNDPSITLIHKDIIESKSFLKNLYIDFYNEFIKILPINTNNLIILELGSGGSFIKKILKNTITSDIIFSKNIDIQFSATSFPFNNKSIDIIIMIDVLHHINNVDLFFREAQRSLNYGGKIIMVEPANTIWGRFIYQNFHHENFDPLSNWKFKSRNPLLSANGALPWIIFFRDRKIFENKFSTLKIKKLQPHTPFRYLISGGLSIKQLLPSFTYNIIKLFEICLFPLYKYIGMFLTIELENINKD